MPGTLRAIVAATLSNCNGLLPKGFIMKVNNSGAGSLTGTNPNLAADSYTPYFKTLTHRLNQCFPVRDNPWLTFTKTRTPIKLAFHSIPTDILPSMTNSS